MNDAPAALPVRRARRGGEHRVEQQPALVLHSYPWRETSLIVEVFTRDHGRLALVARGAKRPASQFRGLLAPFAPLLVSWSGRGDIKTLARVEWCGGLAPLRGDALFAGFYLNELLVRLLARGDPHERLFAHYLDALRALAREQAAPEAALRGFELALLRETGHAPAFDHCADGAPVEPEGVYRLDAQRGLVRTEQADDDGTTLSGRTALALARADFGGPEVLAESKRVLRHLIGYHLNGQPLNTRRILQDLAQL